MSNNNNNNNVYFWNKAQLICAQLLSMHQVLTAFIYRILYKLEKNCSRGVERLAPAVLDLPASSYNMRAFRRDYTRSGSEIACEGWRYAGESRGPTRPAQGTEKHVTEGAGHDG